MSSEKQWVVLSSAEMYASEKDAKSKAMSCTYSSYGRPAANASAAAAASASASSSEMRAWRLGPRAYCAGVWWLVEAITVKQPDSRRSWTILCAHVLVASAAAAMSRKVAGFSSVEQSLRAARKASSSAEARTARGRGICESSVRRFEGWGTRAHEGTGVASEKIGAN